MSKIKRGQILELEDVMRLLLSEIERARLATVSLLPPGAKGNRPKMTDRNDTSLPSFLPIIADGFRGRRMAILRGD
jgi:hypothetical protein